MAIRAKVEGREHVGWDIKVRHEETDDRARLIIEAGTDVPDDVISAIAGSYWFEQVQMVDDDWEDTFFEGEGEEPGGLHG